MEKYMENENAKNILKELKAMRNKQKYYNEPLKAMNKINEIIYKYENSTGK